MSDHVPNDGTLIPIENIQLAQANERIKSSALAFHQYFDRFIFQANPNAQITVFGFPSFPSYHNEAHIAAVAQALEAVLKAQPNSDPFKIRAEFDRFKVQSGLAELDEADLTVGLELAVYCHDLGNITQTPALSVIDGQPGLDYAATYKMGEKVGKVEARSAALATGLIERFYPKNDPKKEPMQRLVTHLIMQTVFDPDHLPSDEPPPFWRLMQTVDQVGSAYFSKNTYHESLAGLLNEHRVVRELTWYRLRELWEFPRKSLKALVPDNKSREAVLSIFETNPIGRRRNFFEAPRDTPNRLVNYDTDVAWLASYRI